MVEQEKPKFDLDEYFMQIARTAHSRSTCDRKHVGAVLVSNEDDELFSTGYNGSPSKRPHCDEVGHFIHEGHCVRIVHAEINAILNAARVGNGKLLENSTMYVTASPCPTCLVASKQAGVKRIVYDEPYRDEVMEKLAKDSGIEVVWLKNISDSKVQKD